MIQYGYFALEENQFKIISFYHFPTKGKSPGCDIPVLGRKTPILPSP
jgi:hypothetical protein